MTTTAVTPERRELPEGQCIADFIPMMRIELSGWTLIKGNPRLQDGAAYQKNGVRVIVSAAIERDGNRWLHVSASRGGRMPSWFDLGEVKRDFIGDDRLAIQVFPPKAEYVNINPDVLHLWACIDARVIPDFRITDSRTGATGI